MPIDPKTIRDGWAGLLLRNPDSLFDRERHVVRCEVLSNYAQEAIPALLAEREEMIGAIRSAVEWMERPGLDAATRGTLERRAAFLR